MNLLPAAELLKLQRPLVIAHRGYSAFAPENSIPAFEMACEAGVDFVEFDTRNSSDDVPFVLHDELLDRTTDVYARWGKRRLKIRDCESGRLKELKNGLLHAPPHPGARLPTVESAARTILKGSALLIERKAGSPESMNRTLSRLGAVPFSVVQSFDWGYLRRYRALSSEQLLGALGPPAVWRGSRLAVGRRLLNARFLDEIRGSGFQLAVWNHQVDRASVREAHRRGLKVFVYTVNDPAEALRLLQAGVDGLISDNPCRIWRVMLDCVRASGTASSGASRKGSATR